MGERSEKLVLAPVRLHQRPGIGLELVALSSDLVALLVKLEEHASLPGQDVGLDRLIQEINGPRLVASKSALAIGRPRREKDNRDPARSLGSPHAVGGFVGVPPPPPP